MVYTELLWDYRYPMRIDGIRVHNFLSFDHFVWDGVDPTLAVLVGPNGAGKTSLLHAIRAVVDALTYEARSHWEELAHQPSSSPRWTIELAVELDGEWEQEAVCAFMAAALCQGDIHLQIDDDDPRPILSSLLRSTLRPHDVDFLFRGSVRATCAAPGYWTLRYVSRPESPVWFEWVFQGGSTALVLGKPPTRNSRTLEAAWKEHLPKADRTKLDRYLAGAQRPPTLDWRSALRRVKGACSLEVGGAQSPKLATHHHFYRLMGIDASASGNRTFDGRYLFGELLGRAVVFTENVRRRPTREFPISELSAASVPLADGERLALHLFQTKNGSDAARREFARTQHLFRELAGRTFDVELVHAPPQRRMWAPEAPVEPKSAELVITVGDAARPLEYAGAGIAEALYLSAVLAAGEQRVLLLDEPALNLHQTVQKRVAAELLRRTTGQVIMVTHSPALVAPEALHRVSRFYLEGGSTMRAALSNKITREDRATLDKELRRSSDARALLFARAVILVEGETELGALPVWYEREFGKALEDENTALYSVGGDPNFATFVSYLRQFGVAWAIVCDGKVIADRTPSRMVRQLRKAGVPGLPPTSLTGFPALKAVLEPLGVFTHASATQHEWENLPVVATHQAVAMRETGGDSKVRVGRWIAEKFPCPLEVRELLSKVVSHLAAAT